MIANQQKQSETGVYAGGCHLSSLRSVDIYKYGIVKKYLGSTTKQRGCFITAQFYMTWFTKIDRLDK